jgi:Tfp pilus assembly protein PilE
MSFNSSKDFFPRLTFRSGFTIIEMLMYTAIVGMIMATTIYVTTTMYNVRARVNSSSIVHESMEFAEKRIVASLHDASAVTNPASGASSQLTLSMPDDAKDPTVFTLTGGQIYMKEGSRDNLPITSSEVDISSLQFTRGTSEPPVVRIQMTGDRRDARASYSAELTLTTSGIIRLEE